MGLALAGATTSRRLRWAALVIFAIFAIPGFMVGIRGNIVIPVACFVVGTARRRQMMPNWRWLVVLIAALSFGAFIKAGRNIANGQLEGGVLSAANPMNGLNELGYSIRPTGLVYGDLQAGMATTSLEVYWAPLERIILGRLLGYQVTGAVDSNIAFNGYVRSRAGEIGGSPIAEALRALDFPGMLWVMVVIACALAALDALPTTRLANAAVALYSYPFFLWVRNDFTPVIFQVLAATFVLGFLVIFSRRREAGDERPFQNGFSSVTAKSAGSASLAALPNAYPRGAIAPASWGQANLGKED